MRRGEGPGIKRRPGYAQRVDRSGKSGDGSGGSAVRREPLGALFLRFLRLGVLAWGGPAAQIAMIRDELVGRERWVTPERFNRALAVYQVLPGPEAHELCVYMGSVARGRVGGLLAGLGFMLPGLALMLLLSWAYVAVGLGASLVAGALAGMKPAVAALVVRAVHRIGSHAVKDAWLWALVFVGAVAQWGGVHFGWTLSACGAAYAAVRGPGSTRRWSERVSAGVFLALCAGIAGLSLWAHAQGGGAWGDEPGALPGGGAPTAGAMFVSGLRAGLLTFGGAYTVIPFLRNDAVINGGWITESQFLDGLALGGIIPAPLIIFSTFIGFVCAGLGGALAMTVGIFLPAFAFTLIGHGLMERLIAFRPLHAFLDGVTAGVVGLIAWTGVELFRAAVPWERGGAACWPEAVVFGLALAALYRWRTKWVIPAVVLGAGVVGLAAFR